MTFLKSTEQIVSDYENYYPGSTSVEWTKHDFKLNHIFWEKLGHEKSLPIRINNIKDIVEVFQQNNIICWLQGRTLQGAVNNGELPPDHDDDIGVFAEDLEKIEKAVFPIIEKNRFFKIRNTNSLVSFFRDGRYIDICLFTEKGKYRGYGKKWFSKKYFNDFVTIQLYGTSFNIPFNSELLLKEMYQPTLFKKIYGKLFRIAKLKNFFISRFLRTLIYVPHWTRIIIRFAGLPVGIYYRKINYEEFLTLRIEPQNSFNWRWRKKHLDIVTANGRYQTVGEILDYIGDEYKITELINNVKETKTDKPFDEPHNLDPKFWNSGNNFFINCIAYEFRSGVIPYSKANEYIKNGCRPTLYTKEYYNNLGQLTDIEIEKLLKSQPIEITDGSITSGKHRVFAMIGRLIKRKKYTPFWALEINIL